MGDYVADLVVNGCFLIEIKAVNAVANEHVAQVLNYLKASRIRVGVLINFGAPKLEFRRFVLDPVPSSSVSSAYSVVSPPASSG